MLTEGLHVVLDACLVRLHALLDDLHDVVGILALGDLEACNGFWIRRARSVVEGVAHVVVVPKADFGEGCYVLVALGCAGDVP